MVTSEKLHWRLHKHLKGLAKNRLRVRLSPLKSPRTFKDQSNRQFVILCISLLSLLQQYRNVLPTTIKKCLPKENVCVCVCLSVCLCVTSHSYLGTYVLTPYVCSDTLSRHWHQPCSDTLSRHWNQLRWSWRGGARAAAVTGSSAEPKWVKTGKPAVFLVAAPPWHDNNTLAALKLPLAFVYQAYHKMGTELQMKMVLSKI